MDAVRAIALLLGTVLHAGESFMPKNPMWAITDDSASYHFFVRYTPIGAVLNGRRRARPASDSFG